MIKKLSKKDNYYTIIFMCENQVFRIHSDFYYVKNPKESTIFETKLKDSIKKAKRSVFVGDFVTLESINRNQGFISDVKKRKNFMIRPKVANVDQVLIFASLKDPDLSFENIDRQICLCKFCNLDYILIFNKLDLVEDKEIILKIESIYSKISKAIFFISAKEKLNLKQLYELLEGKLNALSGNSGVGKSTFLNSLEPKLKLRSKEVSMKLKRGKHTTRHCEIFDLTIYDENGNCIDTRIIDTPGFSNIVMDFLPPEDLQRLFEEFENIENPCKFKNCTHTKESGCQVLLNENIISNSRYQSYLKFLKESLKYKERITYNGRKCETFEKWNKSKSILKISSKKRKFDRKTLNQNIKKGIAEDEKDL